MTAQSKITSSRLRELADSAGSEIVKILERVWDLIRANHPDLPAVVIVTGSGFIGPARWGHFRANGWTERAEKGAALNPVVGEMFVAGETLARGAAHTLETVLHEAAHVLAQVRGIKDTSRQGRWHNQRFRALAEELGLEYPRESAHPQVGFSEVVLTPGTREEYAPVIEELDQAIRLCVSLPEYLATEGDEGHGAGEHIHHSGRKPRQPRASATNNLKAVCGCPTPRIIRASRKVLAEDPILCGRCREPFEPSDEDR
jgi:SprT-like family.